MRENLNVGVVTKYFFLQWGLYLRCFAFITYTILRFIIYTILRYSLNLIHFLLLKTQAQPFFRQIPQTPQELCLSFFGHYLYLQFFKVFNNHKSLNGAGVAIGLSAMALNFFCQFNCKAFAIVCNEDLFKL